MEAVCRISVRFAKTGALQEKNARQGRRNYLEVLLRWFEGHSARSQSSEFRHCFAVRLLWEDGIFQERAAPSCRSCRLVTKATHPARRNVLEPCIRVAPSVSIELFLRSKRIVCFWERLILPAVYHPARLLLRWLQRRLLLDALRGLH